MAKKKVLKNPQKKIDNRFLIITLLIIGIITIAVIGNFSGKTTNTTSTVLTISPEVIKPGDYVSINLKPAKAGVYKQYWICGENDLCHVRQDIHCGSFKCRKESTGQYKSHPNWDGIYYIKMFDYETNSFVKTYFTVTND